MKEIRGVVVDKLTVGKAILSEPNLKGCTPVQWQEFYEKQARELRKENAVLREENAVLRNYISRYVLDRLVHAIYETECGRIALLRENLVAVLRGMGVQGIE